MRRFCIGDRVICHGNFDGIDLDNKTGAIVYLNDSETCAGVEFDEPFTGGHNCLGTCKMGHGRYGSVEHLEFLESESLDLSQPPFSFDELTNWEA